MFCSDTNDKFLIRATICGLAFACVGVLLGEGLRVIRHRENRTLPQEKEPNSAVKEPAVPSAEILVQRRRGTGLPIHINPNSSIYTLQLNPELQHGLSEESVTGKGGKEWPSKIPGMSKYRYLDTVIIFDFTNRGEPLYNVSLNFKVQYSEPAKVNVKASVNPDKSFHLELGTKEAGVDSGMIAVRQTGPKTFEGFAPGRLFKITQRVVTIPELPKDSTVQIYVVNQTHLVAVCEMPFGASGEIAGTGARGSIKLVYAAGPSGIGLETIPQTFAPSQ